MIVKIDSSFEKDTKKIKDKPLLVKLYDVIELCLNASQLNDVPHCKKMSAYKSYYRIKFGDYRIGLRVENDELIFERILHRKDIYRYFP